MKDSVIHIILNHIYNNGNCKADGSLCLKLDVTDGCHQCPIENYVKDRDENIERKSKG